MKSPLFSRYVFILATVYGLVTAAPRVATGLQFYSTQRMSILEHLGDEVLLFAAKHCAPPDSVEFVRLAGPFIEWPGLIYHVPAKYSGGLFDLYFTGLNETDEQGGGDDITLWGGVPVLPEYEIVYPRGMWAEPPPVYGEVWSFVKLPGVAWDILALIGLVSCAVLGRQALHFFRHRHLPSYKAPG